jgi:hypothetical protein
MIQVLVALREELLEVDLAMAEEHLVHWLVDMHYLLFRMIIGSGLERFENLKSN